MNRLVPVNARADIPSEYAGTPIADLLEYHNLGREFGDPAQPRLIIGMCMDSRKQLHIPENFAYVLRAGGANLRYSEFKVSYAITVADIHHIALIGHNHCGMVNLIARKKQFIEGLVEKAGWNREQAEEHFMHFAPMFEIGNEVDFIASESKRLQLRYPKIMVAPMLYNVDDSRLYLIQ